MNLHVLYGTLISILVAAIYFAIHYLYTRYKLQRYINDAILSAETLEVEGKKKMEDAIQKLCAMIPTVFKPFISCDMIRVWIQAAYDKMIEFAKQKVAKDEISCDAVNKTEETNIE